jgi:hypothetical protein
MPGSGYWTIILRSSSFSRLTLRQSLGQELFFPLIFLSLIEIMYFRLSLNGNGGMTLRGKKSQLLPGATCMTGVVLGKAA